MSRGSGQVSISALHLSAGLHFSLSLQSPADPVPILFLLKSGIMKEPLEEAPQLLVVL